MLLSNRNMGLVKDGLSSSVGDAVPNVGSPLQAGGPVLPRGDTDVLIKVCTFPFCFLFAIGVSTSSSRYYHHGFSTSESSCL